MAEDRPWGITVLHTPEAPTQVAFDLVAIHGLNGHALNTWTHKQNGVMWLRDFLHKEFPDVRIMTYGYNAKFRNFKTDQDLRTISLKLLAELVDHRRSKEEIDRPIVFICHSLGGIVAKQALLLVCPKEQTKVQNAVYGIIFLGTPHNGSNIAAHGKAIANIAAACGPWRPARSLLSALQPNSKALCEIADDFVEKTPGLKLVSFYELNRTSVGMFSRKVVDHNSAVLHVANEIKIPQHTDHRKIATFKSPGDQNFNSIRTRISMFRDDILAKGKDIAHCEPEAGLGGAPLIFEIPYLPCSAFHGREDILSSMEKFFHKSSLRSEKLLTYALYGLGGSGKTQLALKFASLNRDKYKTGVIFFNASSHATLVADFSRISEQLKLEAGSDKVETLKQWLSKDENSDWLLIFDNADDLDDLSITKYFPVTHWGHIIVTSRDHAASHFLGNDGSAVSGLKPEEAVAVLFEKVGIQTPTAEDYEEARAIVEMLDCLPLAVDHGGAYIKTRQKTLAEYRRLYQERKREVLSCKHRLAEYGETVLTTWEVNFRQVERDSKKASNLLLLFCFLNAAHISESMIRRGYIPQKRWDSHGKLTETQSSLDHDLVALLTDEVELDTAIEKLLSFSLIYRNKNMNGSRSFSVHPLVQYCASERVSPAVREEWRLQAILLICHVFPRSPYLEPIYGDLGRSFFPHVSRILGEYDTLERESAVSVSVKRELCPMLLSATRFGSLLWKNQALDRVKTLLQDDLDHYLRVEAVGRESAVLRMRGKRGDADKIVEEFIQSTAILSDGKSDARWNAERGELIVSFAENLIQNGQLSRARSDLCGWKPIVPDSPSMAERLVLRNSGVSLGRILRFEGHFSEALAQFKNIYEECKKDDLYRETSWYSTMLSNIADMHCELDQPADAKGIIEPALAQKTSEGVQHRSYGRRLQHALAESLIRSGSYNEAEVCLQNLRAVYEKIRRPDRAAKNGHFRTWGGLARISHLRCRWDEALERWQQTLILLERCRTEKSFVSGVIHYSIAHVLSEQGRLKVSSAAKETAKSILDGEAREYWDVGFGTYWYDFVMKAIGEEVKEMKDSEI